MGKRITRVYTRTGDDGSTGLGDGSRAGKASRRIQAIGDVDELNSFIGLLLAEVTVDELRQRLTDIQHVLFDVGGELSIPGANLLRTGQGSGLEQHIDALNDTLPPLENFILPGGSRAAALCHVARAVCRRAERSVTALAEDEPVTVESRIFLNRLSDLLFVMARVLARREGGAEVLWEQGRSGRD